MATTLVKSLCKKNSKKKPTIQKPLKISHKGSHYHLKELFDKINNEYFENKVDLHITWSRRTIRGARRCRRLGCFVPSKKLIRISQILDDNEIPCFFISFIVYHEILHHLYPPVKKGRGWIIHHEEFRENEKKFKEYQLVKDWEKEIGKKKFFLE